MVGIVTLLSNCFASNSAAWNDTSSNSSGNTWPAQQPPNGSWLGWGADVYNNHWASKDTIIDVDNVGSMELTCSMFYDPGVSATPYVEGNLVYYPTWSMNPLPFQDPLSRCRQDDKNAHCSLDSKSSHDLEAC